MADLPTGTITLLFTDIEGSTRLLRSLGPRYAEVLAEYRRKGAMAAAVAAMHAIQRFGSKESEEAAIALGVDLMPALAVGGDSEEAPVLCQYLCVARA